MTASQTNQIHRIDRERQQLAGQVRTRLLKRAKALATSARKGEPIDPNAFTQAVARLAMIARLKGMRRTVLDASNALRRDVRVSHLTLSREEDEDDRDWLLWLIAWLGLGTTAVEVVRVQGQQIASAASRELTRVAQRAVTQRVADIRAAAQVGRAASVLSEPGGVDIARRAAPLEWRQTTTSPDADPFGEFGKTDVSRAIGPAFDRAGIGAGNRHLIDTWAETIAYEEYEAGRNDGTQLPAVAEALWGYRWSSVLDTRTSLGCRSLDGWVAPISDSWMKALAPPRHFHCRSVLVPIWQTSRLRPPEPFRPSHLTDATLARYLRDKEEFTRRLA